MLVEIRIVWGSRLVSIEHVLATAPGAVRGVDVPRFVVAPGTTASMRRGDGEAWWTRDALDGIGSLYRRRAEVWQPLDGSDVAMEHGCSYREQCGPLVRIATPVEPVAVERAWTRGRLAALVWLTGAVLIALGVGFALLDASDEDPMLATGRSTDDDVLLAHLVERDALRDPTDRRPTARRGDWQFDWGRWFGPPRFDTLQVCCTHPYVELLPPGSWSLLEVSDGGVYWHRDCVDRLGLHPFLFFTPDALRSSANVETHVRSLRALEPLITGSLRTVDVRRVVARALGAIQSCVEHTAGADGPTPRFRVRLVIFDGRLIEVHAVDGAPFAACVSPATLTASFPRRDGITVVDQSFVADSAPQPPRAARRAVALTSTARSTAPRGTRGPRGRRFPRMPRQRAERRHAHGRAHGVDAERFIVLRQRDRPRPGPPARVRGTKCRSIGAQPGARRTHAHGRSTGLGTKRVPRALRA